MPGAAGAPLDLVEDMVVVGGRSLVVLRPRDSEALLDDEAFEHEEFLPYWAELWPSALALARAVSTLPLARLRVVELGCGLGLPSIAAAMRGADVLATDWSPDAIAATERNARRNAAVLETAVCSWLEPAPLVDAGPWDLVLASDVLYERRNVDLLLDLLPRLVREGGEVLLAEPGRPPAAAFFECAPQDWKIASSVDALSPRVSLYRLKAGRTLMEPRGLEPLAYALPARRSPS